MICLHRHALQVSKNEKSCWPDPSWLFSCSYIPVLVFSSVSLRELCDNEDDDVVHAFEQLSRSYREKLNNV